MMVRPKPAARGGALLTSTSTEPQAGGKRVARGATEEDAEMPDTQAVADEQQTKDGDAAVSIMHACIRYAYCLVVSMIACMCTDVRTSMHACIYLCMHACMHACTAICLSMHAHRTEDRMHNSVSR